jgi:hypothetical protein
MTELPPEPTEPRPKGKRGPPKGTRGGGRVRGTKNKATLERELQARLEHERLAELERLAAGAKDQIALAQVAGVRLMKEIAFEFAAQFATLAAYYRPQLVVHDGAVIDQNPNGNEAKYKEYAVLGKDTAIAAAPFQSPRYSAVMVGQTQLTKVVVEGGMPDEFSAPGGEYVDLKATEVVLAEDVPSDPVVVKIAAG